ncbi:MAG: hypothetical protein AABW75_00585 [Nanoarchaeota archaeon]|mgnify:CR=1 FL=1
MINSRDVNFARIIEVLWNMKDSEILRYAEEDNIVRDYGVIKVLIPLPHKISPYYSIKIISNSNSVYMVKQPKHMDRRLLNLAQIRR